MEWNIICRICLHEGEMRSIYERDDDGLTICDKIMKCSDVKIKKDENLPENICLKCYETLIIAFEFRNKCEGSNIILQSFLKETTGSVFTSDEKEQNVINHKGITIKRVLLKPSQQDEDIEKDEEEIITGDYYDGIDDTEIKIEQDVEVIKKDYHEAEDREEENGEMEIQEVAEYHIEMNDAVRDDCEQFTIDLKDGYIEEELTELIKANISSIKTEVPVKRQRRRKIQNSMKQTNNGTVKKKREKFQKMHICDICGNVYKQKHSFDTHMRRHRNEKPFECEICGRKFVLNVELKCHMRTHTGQKPYGCRYCERHFSDFGSRIKHERVHTGERPYVCETCGKAFAYSYGLSSHILTHTGEKPFGCPECGRRFTKKHHLKNHLQTHRRQELKMKLHKGIQIEEIEKIEDDFKAITKVVKNEYTSFYIIEKNEQEEGENV